jgi:hypothetical protein
LPARANLGPGDKYHALLSPSTLHTLHPAFEDGTDRGFRNVGKSQSEAGEIPKRTHTIFKTRRKFEIKNFYHAIVPLVVFQERASSCGSVTIRERWELKETQMGNPHKLSEVTEVVSRVM